MSICPAARPLGQGKQTGEGRPTPGASNFALALGRDGARRGAARRGKSGERMAVDTERGRKAAGKGSLGRAERTSSSGRAD